ncbi:nuclear transport factor 2 family protein [Deinococcus misasensis]|uniref:nuclear transport factor 2 family protein n=1 Tax=Deinococcus misasensis TaxID=392413 RepID=UPI000690D8E8|nr:nuclear transport factor 2 family protein [Deinococcus misasensis]
MDEVLQSPDRQMIENLLQVYFDGLYTSDPQKLSEVFHPQAHYITPSQGDFLQLSLQQYLQRVSQRTSLEGTGFIRTDRIERIEQLSEDTALAVVTCSLPGRRFKDLLALAKTEGRWTIVSKVFHWDPLPESERMNP